tara:strand:+ start:4799 stop:6682 length:1884 start_codon:yes stop_codon:yes gene_type:complete
MPDFENNPTFNSEIQKIDPNLGVNFGYIWNAGLKAWVPDSGASISVDNLELNLDASDTESHRLLSGISGELANLENESSDEETHRLLTAISGLLDTPTDGINSDERTHELLSGVSGLLEESLATEDEESHRLLSGISGLIEDSMDSLENTVATGFGHTHVMINQTHTHLQDINESIDNLTSSNQNDFQKVREHQETQINKLQESIDVENLILEELEDANLLHQENIDVNSGILDSSEEIEDLIEGSNEWLSGISGVLEKLNIEIGADPENHRILSGISGQDEVHYIENERNLRNISTHAEQLSLSVEELKSNFRDLTFYVKKFEEEGMVQEEDRAFEPLAARSFRDKVFDKVTYNGRLNNNESPELSQSLLLAENFQGEANKDRVYVFDEAMPHSIRFEDYKGNEDGYQSLFPFPKKLGSDDRVTIYNDSPFPLEVYFRGGQEDFKLHEGQKMELTKDEAYQAFLRREYTISGFEVRYSIERMYTPEENVFDEKDSHIMKPEQTHSRVGLGSIVADNDYVYVAYGEGWKRLAIADWEQCNRKDDRAFPLDYYDTYCDEHFLYLKQDVDRRIALAEWAYTSQIPMQGHNNFWADKYFIYLKHVGASNKVGGDKGKDEWRRYALAEFAQ